MKRASSVEEYIELHPEWASAMARLRGILLDSELEEAVKWGGPVYTLGGKNVVGIGAFKEHVALWFHQGVYLEDRDGVLVNAQEGKTKALRQWRFNSEGEIDAKLIRRYVMEAIENQKAGKELKPDRSRPLEIPQELAQAMKENGELAAAFERRFWTASPRLQLQSASGRKRKGTLF